MTEIFKGLTSGHTPFPHTHLPLSSPMNSRAAREPEGPSLPCPMPGRSGETAQLSKHEATLNWHLPLPSRASCPFPLLESVSSRLSGVQFSWQGLSQQAHRVLPKRLGQLGGCRAVQGGREAHTQPSPIRTQLWPGKRRNAAGGGHQPPALGLCWALGGAHPGVEG